MTKILAIFGSILMVIAYIVYNNQILFGDAKPSIAAWLVFGFLVILNSSSYFKMNDDWVMSLLPIVGAVANLITTVIVVIKGGDLGSLTITDHIVLILGIIAGLVWWTYQNAGYANVIVIIAVVIGFIPIYYGIYSGNVRENYLAWFIWTLSYIFGTFVVLNTWKEKPEKKNKLALVYPVACGILHFSVGAMTWLKG